MTYNAKPRPRIQHWPKPKRPVYVSDPRSK